MVVKFLLLSSRSRLVSRFIWIHVLHHIGTIFLAIQSVDNNTWFRIFDFIAASCFLTHSNVANASSLQDPLWIKHGNNGMTNKSAFCSFYVVLKINEKGKAQFRRIPTFRHLEGWPVRAARIPALGRMATTNAMLADNSSACPRSKPGGVNANRQLSRQTRWMQKDPPVRAGLRGFKRS